MADTYVTVADHFPEHPKVIGLSDAALACWLRGLCYSSRHLTDGVIQRHIIRVVGKPKAAAELVERGLWDETDDGWVIHDYDHHQRTRDEIVTIQKTKSRAGTIGNHKRHHVQTGKPDPTCPFCSPDTSQNGRKPVAGATDVRSQTPRKPSPETETESDTASEAETETETSKAAVSNFQLVAVEGGDATTRVRDALEWMANKDLERAKYDERDIGSESHYWKGCYESRKRKHAVDLLKVAQAHPNLTAEQLAEAMRDITKYGGVA